VEHTSIDHQSLKATPEKTRQKLLQFDCTKVKISKFETWFSVLCYSYAYLDLKLQKFHIIHCLFKHCTYINLQYTHPSVKLIHNSIRIHFHIFLSRNKSLMNIIYLP